MLETHWPRKGKNPGYPASPPLSLSPVLFLRRAGSAPLCKRGFYNGGKTGSELLLFRQTGEKRKSGFFPSFRTLRLNCKVTKTSGRVCETVYIMGSIRSPAVVLHDHLLVGVGVLCKQEESENVAQVWQATKTVAYVKQPTHFSTKLPP